MEISQFVVKFGIPALPLSARGEPLLPVSLATPDRITVLGWRKGGGRIALVTGSALSCLSVDKDALAFLGALGIPFSHAHQRRGGTFDFFYRGCGIPSRISLFGRKIDLAAGFSHVPEGDAFHCDNAPLPEIPVEIAKEAFS